MVDGDEGVTQIFARMLQREGCGVRTALSAETSLHEVEDSRPDASPFASFPRSVKVVSRLDWAASIGHLSVATACLEARSPPVLC